MCDHLRDLHYNPNCSSTKSDNMKLPTHCPACEVPFDLHRYISIDQVLRCRECGNHIQLDFSDSKVQELANKITVNQFKRLKGVDRLQTREDGMSEIVYWNKPQSTLIDLVAMEVLEQDPSRERFLRFTKEGLLAFRSLIELGDQENQ